MNKKNLVATLIKICTGGSDPFLLRSVVVKKMLSEYFASPRLIPPNIQSVNCYLLFGGRKVIVDTGFSKDKYLSKDTIRKLNPSSPAW